MKRVKRTLSALLIASLLLTLWPLSVLAAPRSSAYSDVRTSDWFYEPVQYVSERGLMTGTGEGVFSPQLTTSRAMIVAILHRMEGSPTAKTGAFSDVQADDWFAQAVDWASAQGIVSGYGDGRFLPNASITREQIASILYRYADYKGADVSARGSLSAFRDADKVSSYAREVMQWAVGSGLMAGESDNMLAPQTGSSRAVAATLLMRFCENILNDQAPEQPLQPSVEDMDMGNGDSLYVLEDDQVAYDSGESLYYVNNMLLAFVDKGLSSAEKTAIAASVDGVVAAELKGDLNLLQIEVADADLATLRSKATTLMRNSHVTYATIDAPTPSSEVGVAATTSDTSAYGDWWYSLIGADAAWSSFSTVFQPITVGVLDGGVNARHEDFNGDVSFASDAYYDWNYNDTLLGASDAEVRHEVDHGTHVTGIIVAAHDGDAVNGIAPNAKVVFADFAADASQTDAQQWQSAAKSVSALKAVVAKGAKVVNASYGYHYKSQQSFERAKQEEIDDNLPASERYYSTFASWGDYLAARNAAAAEISALIAGATCDLLANGEDFLVVQAAGNGVDNAGPGVDAHYASYWAGINAANSEALCARYGLSYDTLDDHILIVGSITREHEGNVYQMDPAVNYGDAVDIYAPGVEILSTVAYDAQNVLDLDSTGVLSGTSMAAPIVSGAAALVWSADKSLSASEVRDLLLNHHLYTAAGSYSGSRYSNVPVVDVCEAVKAVLGTPETDRGSGTASDPYKISTAAELQALAAKVNSGASEQGVYYALTADIDLSGYVNWTPIGDSAVHAFSGHFDGKGHTISGLRIYDAMPNDYLGLFGNLDGAEVCNLTLENVELHHVVDGTSHSGKEIGAVAAHARSSSISGCHVSGTLSVVAAPVDLNTKVGGIVGTLWSDSALSNCSSTASVAAGASVAVGGIVGHAQSVGSDRVRIEGCRSSGSVLHTATGDHSLYGYVDNVDIDGHLTTYHPIPA